MESKFSLPTWCFYNAVPRPANWLPILTRGWHDCRTFAELTVPPGFLNSPQLLSQRLALPHNVYLMTSNKVSTAHCLYNGKVPIFTLAKDRSTYHCKHYTKPVSHLTFKSERYKIKSILISAFNSELGAKSNDHSGSCNASTFCAAGSLLVPKGLTDTQRHLPPRAVTVTDRRGARRRGANAHGEAWSTATPRGGAPGNHPVLRPCTAVSL